MTSARPTQTAPPTRDGALALSADALHVGYGRQPDTLRGASVRLESGELVGLVGANGSGKTTLFRALAGLLPLRSGTLRLHGARIDRLGLARRARMGLGYLPQHAALLWDRTARDNVQAALDSPAARAARAWRAGPAPTPDDLLAQFGLTEQAALRAAALSGGQARRLELARLLATGARVLLCDEPFAGLDADSVRALQASLRQRVAATPPVTVLVTDHRLDALDAMCDRLIQVHNGLVAPSQPADALAALHAPLPSATRPQAAPPAC